MIDIKKGEKSMSQDYGTFFAPWENSVKFDVLNNAAKAYASALRARANIRWSKKSPSRDHVFDGVNATENVLIGIVADLRLATSAEAVEKVGNFKRCILSNVI